MYSIKSKVLYIFSSIQHNKGSKCILYVQLQEGNNVNVEEIQCMHGFKHMMINWM